MNVCELKTKLKQADLPPYLYNLDGLGRDDERLCLQYANGIGWRVYFLERGIKTTDIVFKSEDEACGFIYKNLLGRT